MEKIEISVHLCTKEELEKEACRYGSDPWYGLKYLRGFRYGNGIWVVKDCEGELALMGHEYGHIRGKAHTKWPGIMNFSGLFRWFCYTPSEILNGIRKIPWRDLGTLLKAYFKK